MHYYPVSEKDGRTGYADGYSTPSIFYRRTYIYDFHSTNDLRFLRSIDIGFFRYNSDRKLWEVVLNNQVPLLLKKNTTAHQITEYAPCFVQIHQSYIININYLIMIKENRCVMYPPFEKITELIVSKKFKKTLQDSFYQL